VRLVLLFVAQAIPWYLFPGNTVKTQPVPEPDSVAVSVPLAIKDSSQVCVDTAYKADIPASINISLILPLNASAEADGNMSDFYLGALLAARSLGEEGLKLTLRPFDISTGLPSLSFLSESDVIIGPVSLPDINSVLTVCPPEKHIISPLDHSVSSLLDTAPIVQVPPSSWQLSESLREWMEEETVAPDMDVILKDGYDFSKLDTLCSPDTLVRFLLASTDERFCSEAVRNVSVQAMLRNRVELYAPSRLRNLENLNMELLHEASTRMVSAYNVNYSDEAVKSFVYSYRALFNAEPGSFAFHGYDTVRFFAHLCAKYGRNWFEKAEEYSEKGLQMTFAFKKRGAGMINSAHRKIIYNKDYSISGE